MNINQIIERILHSKKYNKYPKEFVKRAVLKNLNKNDPLKSTKLMLHEMSGMFKNLKSADRVSAIWKFIVRKIGKQEKILDLGAGNDYGFFKNIDIDYTGVDIFPIPGIVQDDVLNPKKSWKNENYDLVLIINLIPVVERMETGSGKKLINYWEEKSKYIVLSFPLYSITSRKYIGAYWKNYIKEKLNKDYEIIGKEIVVLLKGRL